MTMVLQTDLNCTIVRQTNDNDKWKEMWKEMLQLAFFSSVQYVPRITFKANPCGTLVVLHMSFTLHVSLGSLIHQQQMVYVVRLFIQEG